MPPPPLKGTTLQFLAPDASAFVGVFLAALREEEGKEAFSEILERVLLLQRQELIDNGLTGDFNSAITKLVLGKHGFSDKVDSDVTTKGQKIENNFTILPVETRG